MPLIDFFRLAVASLCFWGLACVPAPGGVVQKKLTEAEHVAACLVAANIDTCFDSLAVKMEGGDKTVKHLEYDAVAASIAYHYSLSAGSKLVKMAYGFETARNQEGTPKHKRDLEDFAEMTAIIAALYAEHQFTLEQAGRDERSLLANLRSNSPSAAIQRGAKDMCRIWGFGAECKLDAGSEPLGIEDKSILAEAIDEDKVLAESASALIARLAGMGLARSKVGPDPESRARAFSSYYVAFHIDNRNWSAVRDAMLLLAFEPTLKDKFAFQAKEMRDAVRSLAGKRASRGIRKMVGTFGMHRLSSSRISSRRFSTDDFLKAVRILDTARSIYDNEPANSCSSSADFALLKALDKRVTLHDPSAIESFCKDAGPPSSVPAPPPKANILQTIPLTEGQVIVEGIVPDPHPRQIQLFAVNKQCADNDDECAREQTEERLGVHFLTQDSKLFAIRLRRELKAGDLLEFRHPSLTGGPPMVYTASPVQSPLNSWGRMRLYGRGGTEINGRGLENNSPLTGALTFDYAPKAITSNSSLGFHIFLEGRLESISVTSKVSLKSELPPGQTIDIPNLGSRCGNSGTCAGPPLYGRSGEAGIYLPILLPQSKILGMPLRWTYRGSQIAAFMAPIWKVGTQGRFGDLPSNRTFEFSYKGSPPLVGEELRRGPYSYRAGGMRFGSFRYFGDAATRPSRRAKPFLDQSAPILGWHIDVMAGRWQTFSAPVGNLPWRLEIRGLAQIPNTPWFAGAFVNTGEGPNDYRFFFGMRTEFAQLISNFIGWRKSRKGPVLDDIPIYSKK